MQAAYYDTFGAPNIQVGERPDPAPDAEHLLVRTESAGVGIWDLGIMAGLFGQVSLPRIPGAEVAGTVEVAAGGFSAGDRVFCSLWESGDAGAPDPRGGFAEPAAARVDSAATIPDGIDFPEAAGLVISASTAYEGLVDRAKLKSGETVLVTAASGGVGSAAVQIARSAGARVIAVASARNNDYVRDLGAETVVDHNLPDFIEQLRGAAPAGFDVLFDGTGNEVRDPGAESGPQRQPRHFHRHRGAAPSGRRRGRDPVLWRHGQLQPPPGCRRARLGREAADADRGRVPPRASAGGARTCRGAARPRPGGPADR